VGKGATTKRGEGAFIVWPATLCSICSNFCAWLSNFLRQVSQQAKTLIDIWIRGKWLRNRNSSIGYCNHSQCDWPKKNFEINFLFAFPLQLLHGTLHGDRFAYLQNWTSHRHGDWPKRFCPQIFKKFAQDITHTRRLPIFLKDHGTCVCLS
jgi:hypothetical protein